MRQIVFENRGPLPVDSCHSPQELSAARSASRVYWLRPALIVGVLATVFGLVSCGSSPDEAIAASSSSSSVVPESVVPESVVPESVVPESVVPESVVPVEVDNLPNAVAEAYVSLTAFADVQVASYVFSNREHFRLLSECMASSGYPDVDLGESEPIVTPVMLDSYPLPLRWSAPPLGFMDTSARKSDFKPSDPNPQEWVPPKFASVEEDQKFFDTLGKCDSEAGFPTVIDYAKSISVDIGMNKIDQSTMALEGFARLDASYRECLGSIGVQKVEYAADGIVFGSNESGLSNQEADAKCRLSLYEPFLSLSADVWQAWLVDNAETLKKLDRYWSGILQKLDQ